MHIDLNSDMGESFGAYSIGADEEILKWVTSANVACGWVPRPLGRSLRRTGSTPHSALRAPPCMWTFLSSLSNEESFG